MVASTDEIVEYARRINQNYPQIDEDHLQKALEAKFIYNKDLLPVVGGGVVCNPLADFIAMLTILMNGVKLLFPSDKTTRAETVDKITEAIDTLTTMK